MVSSVQAREGIPVRTPDLFGHPRGLTFLFATEMWERFSYYGMRAILVLYMVRTLLLPGHAEAVIGLDALKHGFEMLVGPLGPQPLSSHIYGLYTGLVYLTPLFGGLLADRVLGQHRTILLGAGLMAIGHFMMAFEPLFLANLLTGYIYRRFGFLSAVVLRLSFYAVWHVAYGGFRPFWLSL